MLGITLRYIWNIVLGRKNYLRSLVGADKAYEFKMLGITVVFSIFLITAVTFLNYFLNIRFLKSESPELAQLYSSTIPLPISSMLIAIIAYAALLLVFIVTIVLSALALGVRSNFVPAITAMGLISPLFALLMITSSLFYLLIHMPVYVSILYTLWPLFISLTWLRNIYRIGTQIFSMTSGRAVAFILIFLALLFEIAILVAITLPGGVI